MTITNRKKGPRDKVILSDGKLSLVRDMHRPRRYKGKTVYDMAYWAIATSEEGEA